MARDLMPTQLYPDLEKALSVALYLCLGASVLLGVSGVALITLGYDEAWILRGIQGILNSQPPGAGVGPVLTSGGIYAAAQVLIAALVGPELWPQRTFTLVCALLVTAIVWRWSTLAAGTREAGPIGIAALFATPGFFVLGSTAYAALPAFLLVLACFHVYANWGGSTWTRRLAIGLLGGLAAATRFNCAFALPALLVVAAFSDRADRRRQIIDVSIASVIGSLIFVTCVWLYGHVGNHDLVAAKDVRESALRVSLINYPEYLNKWIVGGSFSPLFILVLATCIGAYLSHPSPEQEDTKPISSAPWAALLPFGWMAWAAWLVASPIPHLRYSLAGLAAFWIVIGLGMARLHAWGLRTSKPLVRVAALLLALSCAISSVGNTARNLIHGNGNILSWEWAGESKITYFTRFRHKQYQEEAARYLRETTRDDETVLALGLNHELGYLAERRVVQARTLSEGGLWDADKLPRRLFLSPIIGNFLYLTTEARDWLEENCTLEAQFGPYSFYRVDGSYPEEFSFLRAIVETYPGHPLSSEYR